MRRFGHSIKQAFSQISRNKVMSGASLLSITAILLVLGVFFIFIVNVNNMAEGVKQDFDQIQIDLDDTVTEVETQKLMSDMDALEGVSEVVFMSREEAMEHWKIKWGDNADLLDRLKTNPLPNSVILSITDIGFTSSIVAEVNKMNGIDKIHYSQETIDKLLDVTKFIQIATLIIIIFLVFISILIVSNTIKLTVVAREKEITIMRYVGATNWFIRGPFLIEGMIIGIISAAVSAGIIAVVYHYVIENFGTDFLLLMSSGFVPERFMIENLLYIFLALGISIGACGSIISMRRFLVR